jgi:hypothetical protein
MKFEIGPFNFRIERKKNKLGKVTQQDIDIINDYNVNRMINVGEDYYKQKLTEITLHSHNTFEDLKKAKSKLHDDGIIIIPNFLNNTYLDEWTKSIEKTLKIYTNKLKQETYYEDEKILIQKNINIPKLKNYKELASYPKTAINIRGGIDSGMVDIFNIDKILPYKSKIQEIFSSEFFREILSFKKGKLKVSNVNAYINSGNITTRGFHFDSEKNQVKIFIYLTDVSNFNDGPYTFVKKSHLDKSSIRINKKLSFGLKNETEAPIVNHNNIYPVFGKKGSMIISNQNGFHRGFPQSKNGYRVVLAINCI